MCRIRVGFMGRVKIAGPRGSHRDNERAVVYIDPKGQQGRGWEIERAVVLLSKED